MSSPVGLYAYPPATDYGRPIPKSRIYAKARPSTAVKNAMVNQVESLIWAQVLAPRTLNLSATDAVAEIVVIKVVLKTPDLDLGVLRSIDKAIGNPVIFELLHGNKAQGWAAYKRPNDVDASKWVVGELFGTAWQSAANRLPLPAALDMGLLYENMLKPLLPLAARRGERLVELVGRVENHQRMVKELLALKSQLKAEKQFNRKVELNARVRALSACIEILA